MGNIIPLHGDPHAMTQELLPWYVNGTLDAGERHMVAEHLAACEACRAELEREKALAGAYVELPHEGADQWSEVRARALASAQARPRRVSSLPGWMAPGRLALIAASQVAIISGSVAIYSQLSQPVPAEYHALSAAPAPAPAGNIIVMFRPDIEEQALRAALRAVNARIVDGPNAADAYVLAVPGKRLDAALSTLRARSDIVLAQPIGPASRP